MKAKTANQKQRSKTRKADDASTQAEQVSAAESLRRMKAFVERKENFVAAVKKSKN
jgi:hypothetical protein